MESFSAESRSAVQEALNSLRQAISRELENELDKKLKKDAQSREYLHDELEILRSRSEEVDRLEQENRNLRTKLLRFHQDGRATKSPTPATRRVTNDQGTNTDPVPIESIEPEGERENILRESHKILKKYNVLDKNFKTLMASYKKEKEDKRQWEEYAKSLEDKLKRLEGPSGKLAVPTKPASEPRRPRSTATPSLTAGPGVESAKTDEPAEAPGAAHDDPIPAPIQKEHGRKIPEEYSTEGDTMESGKDADMPTLPPLKQNVEKIEVHIKAELSSDGLEVISERYVGKRKRVGDTADSPGRARIKIESSNLTNSLPSTQIQESMDLDELGPRVTTPKRKRQAEIARAKSTDSVFVRPDNISTPAAKPADSSAVLTPVNPNARLVRPREKMLSEQPTRKGLAQGIRSLAEDGLAYKEFDLGDSVERQFRTPQPGGRLNNLLNSPSTDQAPAIVRSAPRLRDPNPLVSEELELPNRRQLPFNKDRREKSKAIDDVAEEAGPMRGLSKNRAAVETPLTSSKAHLRSKPVAVLRLGDFKINPKFNDGSDYAYSEVVRGHDRAGLPGCTDMNCCGPHFRAMALAQKNSHDRSVASDNKLFEDYLGDRISTILGMSKAEKEELWVKAKTWQLANELGKHRHRYARRSSPPGYWNTEFPSTQEDQAEKAEYERREKEMIQERYRDAVRGGRRWLFRDE